MKTIASLTLTGLALVQGDHIRGTDSLMSNVAGNMKTMSLVGGGARCTGAKAAGRSNKCLWDSNRCVDKYGQCGILESKAAQVCADWGECGGVVCKSGYNGYCLARKKIDGSTKNGMWAYKKAVGVENQFFCPVVHWWQSTCGKLTEGGKCQRTCKYKSYGGKIGYRRTNCECTPHCTISKFKLCI